MVRSSLGKGRRIWFLTPSSCGRWSKNLYNHRIAAGPPMHSFSSEGSVIMSPSSSDFLPFTLHLRVNYQIT